MDQPNCNTVGGGASSSGGGGTSSVPIFFRSFPSGSADANNSFSDERTDVAVNGQLRVDYFDVGDENEYQDMTPAVLDGSLTFIITMSGLANIRPVSAANVQFNLKISQAGNGEDWNVVYSDNLSGDLSVNTTASTPPRVNIHSWSKTVSAAGLLPNKQTRFILTREPAASDELTGEYGVSVTTIGAWDL